MAVIEPIYSIEKGCEVYHNNSNCTERNNIETRNVRAGTGNKRLCHHCATLNRHNSSFGLGLMGGAGKTSLVEAFFRAQEGKRGK